MVELAIVLLFAQDPAAGARPPVGASWEFTIEPLLWIPSLEGEGAADGGGDVDLDRGGFDDFFGELDAGFLLALEAKAPDSPLSIVADGLWVRFADDEGSLQTTTALLMLEAGAAWELEGSGFAPTAGLRYVGLSLDVDAGGLDAGATQGWVDPWIGGRWRGELLSWLDLSLRADVGGFGVGSDFTWQAMAALRVALGDHFSLDLGYRALSVDFDDDDLAYDALAHGPVIGLAFTW